jgi:hypothetical protein
MSFSKDKTFELFGLENKLLYKKNITKSPVLFYGVDRDGKFLLIQTNDYNYLYNIEGKTSHRYKNNFKQVITSFAVKSDTEMILGTSKGLLLETQRSPRKFKTKQILDYGENLAIRDIRYSKNKEWFYALAQRGNYNKIGYNFSNELISDLQTETSRIGYKPVEESTDLVHKTSVSYTKSYDIVDLELRKGQKSNAVNLKQSHTQGLSFYKESNKSFKKIVNFSEISSFEFNKDMSQFYASSKIDKSTFKIDMKKFFENPSKSFENIQGQHNNFIKSHNNHVYLANADSRKLVILDSKNKIVKKLETNSAIRNLYESGDSLFLIEENGSIQFISNENGKFSLKKYMNVNSDLARNIEPKAIKNKLQLTTSTGDKIEVFFPKNCKSVFQK